MSNDYPWLKDGVWPKRAPKEIDYSNEKRTLIDILKQSVDSYPDNPYLFFSGLEHTYSEVWTQVQNLATALADKGVTKDDTVAILMINTPQFVISMFAIQYLGCVASLLSTLHVSEELLYHINDSESTVLLASDFLYDRVIPIKEKTKLRLVVTTSVGDVLKPIKRFLGKKLKKYPVPELNDNEALKWRDMLKVGAELDTKNLTKVDRHDTAMLIYTGGTTGLAKGAELSHHNLITNLIGVGHWTVEPITNSDVFMGALPFFHSFGMTVALMAATYFGAGLVVAPDPRNLKALLDAVEEHKVTYYPGVPAMYISLLNSELTKKADISTIKFCFSGAAPLPVEIQKQFEELTGATMLEGFGMTELSPIASTNPPGRSKSGSIGLPIPNTVMRLVGIEDGVPIGMDKVGPDNLGEIVVAGPQVMKGYYNKPEETKEALEELDGRVWMHTGDIGYMDEEGYFFIVDRKKDMIIVSGYKVFPRDVEEAFYKHPAVLQVAVVGIPDPKTTERVKIFIELKEGHSATEEEMFKHCEKHLASYRRPKEIEFRSLGEFTTMVGKVLKRKLRE